MEFSSPLAAMRPQPVPTWGNRKDLGIGRFGHWNTFTSTGQYDFKTMSMFQPQQQTKPKPKPQPKSQPKDYFNSKPVQRSSPTSSLTADLDANFHIESSPQVPTPRRSLFTANIFKPLDETDRLSTPPIETEDATTPPIPASSPGADGMDISPLPHKAPYFVAQVTLPSPSPEETPSADESMSSPDLLSPDQDLTPTAPPPVLAPTFLPVPERRRPVTRPSLSRSKGYSMNCIPTRPSTAENQLPAFQFGAVATNGLQSASTPTLLETHCESPVQQQERKQFDPSAMMPPPPRRTSLSNGSRATGSPSACHVRKPSQGRQPFSRPPRKQMRRSLSMFQHPDEVMKEEEESYEQPAPTLASVMDVDMDTASHTPKLPHFIPDEEPDSLPRITRESMVDILDGKYNDSYDQISIIDCRFEYEYNGGHIDGAVNFNDKTNLSDKLFTGDHSSSTLLIFHCEYSVHRAPLTAKYIRNHDRNINAASYPHLTYPEMYILDGGYSKFFSNNPSKCYPQSYVEMNDHRHEEACEAGLAKVKQQRRAPLNRAQTFAFGQNCHDEMEDSPTAAGRGGIGNRTVSAVDMGLDISPGFGGGSSFARRMASY